MSTIEAQLNELLLYNNKDPIEKDIWQLWRVSNITDDLFPTNCVQLTDRWREANPEYAYHLVSMPEAERIVSEALHGEVPEVLEALHSLPDEKLRLEFLKYLLLYIQGGVYADIDTIDIKPISHWKEVFSGNSMNLVVGVVSDYNYEGWERFFNRRLVLSSSIFLAKSHHPMLAKLVSKIAYICISQGKLIQGTDWKTALSEYDVNGDPVIQFTGPSILTDTFFEYMNGLKSVKLEMDEQDRIELKNTEVVGPKVSDIFSYRNITGISRGVTVGDTMILPQISFNGFENSHEDEYDDNDLSTGYESLFYGRPLSLTEWSHRKVRFDST